MISIVAGQIPQAKNPLLISQSDSPAQHEPAIAPRRLESRGDWSIVYLGGPTIQSGLSQLAADIRATCHADQLGDAWDCFDNSVNGVNEYVLFQVG